MTYDEFLTDLTLGKNVFDIKTEIPIPILEKYFKKFVGDSITCIFVTADTKFTCRIFDTLASISCSSRSSPMIIETAARHILSKRAKRQKNIFIRIFNFFK